ncbi:MAG: hypothetical protein ACD_29C00054G0003 [uncultured bacterium]|nr:MAG: hypothetical protein ACD_29C00054G0003 [uncultured bacterium]
MKMRALILNSVFLLSAMSATLVNADCSVIGFHQPDSFIYNGPTTCDIVNLPEIIVHGTLFISSSTISGNTIIRGLLNATGATLSGNTEVSGSIVSSGSVFSNINITDNHSPDTITLSNNSIVSGDITFEGGIPGNNKVIIESNSKLHGKVNNGIIINR